MMKRTMTKKLGIVAFFLAAAAILEVAVVSSFQPPMTTPRTKLFTKINKVIKQSDDSFGRGGLIKEQKQELFQLFAKPSPETETTANGIFTSPLVFAIIAGLYWYLLVFGAAAQANGLFVPSFVPMVPGWPPSDADLVPVIEDSVHFFYISDAIATISGQAAQSPPQLRLAFFNFAEAWVFSFLPLLLADKKRLPLPVVLGTWIGALGLTNAFLAPYLMVRQVFSNKEDDDNDKSIQSKFLNLPVGGIATLVVGYAAFQTALTTVVSPNEWTDFFMLVTTDRTYLAFAIDLVLFSVFQSFLVDEWKSQQQDESGEDSSYGIPFVGLMAWMFRS